MKNSPKPQLAIKCLLLMQPALDPPNITIRLGGEAKVKTIAPHESGAVVSTETGRSYIIPWSNIRHAEIESI